MNLVMLLEMAAETFPDRVAVKAGSLSLTYAELQRGAWAAAALIRASGCRYIGLLDINSVGVPMAIFGAAYAGVPYVPINYRLTASEINELLTRITPALLIVGAEYAASLKMPDGMQPMASDAFMVPTMLARVVEAVAAGASDAADLPALRAIAYGGGKMPIPVIEKALRLWPKVDFTNAYGLTETSSTIALLGPEDHRVASASSDPVVHRRLGSVGQPLPTIEMEIRDDDVIVRGGENISPGEIEDVLLDHPAVADVAVVSIIDPQWGEAVAAAVVLKDQASVSAAELQDWVKARLRSSRVPVAIRFREELPYNETGKLLRRVVRQEFMQASA